MSRWILPAVLIGLLAVVVLTPDGPSIDPSKVVSLGDLAPAALHVFSYSQADGRGWPTKRKQRAYIRFLQDNGVKFAFVAEDRGQHSVTVGILDAMQLRTLHQKAKQNGLVVPDAAFTARFD